MNRAASEQEVLRAGGRYSDVENNNNASEDDNNERSSSRGQPTVAISTETPSPKIYENWPVLIPDDDDVRQVDGASCASSPCSSVVHDPAGAHVPPKTRDLIEDVNAAVKRFSEYVFPDIRPRKGLDGLIYNYFLFRFKSKCI